MVYIKVIKVEIAEELHLSNADAIRWSGRDKDGNNNDFTKMEKINKVLAEQVPFQAEAFVKYKKNVTLCNYPYRKNYTT